MNTPAITTAQRINAIHKDLEALLYKGIEKAIEIGQLLTEKKAELKHGEFGTWISENLIFTDRTARNYMRLFENKDKALEAGNISEAYKMLGEGKTETVSDLTEDGLTALLVKMDDDIKYLKSCFSYLNRNPKTKLFPVPPDIDGLKNSVIDYIGKHKEADDFETWLRHFREMNLVYTRIEEMGVWYERVITYIKQ